MPLSADPSKRAAQLSNLVPGARAAGTGNRRAVQHGAYSAGAIREAREKHLAELAETFPRASTQELVIQAHRLAQLELLGEFVDQRGVIRHKRRGDVFPAAMFMERVAAAFERQHALLVQRKAAAGKYDGLADFLNDDDDQDEDGTDG